MFKKYILTLALIGFTLLSFTQVDRTKAPAAQPNPAIKIEIPEALSFANGLQVIMVENHKLPKVSFQLYIDYPATLDGNKAGVSSIFGEMLASGTVDTPKDQFDEKMDFIGADFYPNARGFYASSLKKHTKELLGLVSQVLTQPAFTQEDFDRIIAQNQSSLASLPSEANSISSNVSSVVKYGNNHPYGEVMTEETLANITLEDIRAYYKQNFIPNHAYLVIVGDISKDDVKGYVETYFQTWQIGTTLEKKDYLVPQSKGNNVYFVDKPGAVQSVINITHTVKLTPGHPDEIKLSVLNQILGGGSFSARLMSNLREDKAYTYGCYSSLSSDQLIGSFSAGGSFRNEVTDSAIVQILAEIKRIAENPVTAKELDLIKKSMTGSFARSLENPQTIARFALNTIRYNLPSNYYSTYLQRLEQITIEELLLVGAQYLQPENLNIIVVGNEEIADKLAKFDKDGRVDFKNYYGEDIQQMKKVEEGVTARSIVDTYLMKMMQVESITSLKTKLNAVQQIETVSVGEISGMKLYVYEANGTPNKTATLLYIKSVQGNMVVQTENFDGEQGQTVSEGQATPYEGNELAAKKMTNYPIAQLVYFENDSIQLTLMGITDLKGVPHYKMKVVDGTDLKFEYYNVETGMLSVIETYVTVGEVESSAITTIVDYEVQSGLLLPKHIVINNDGQLINLELVQVMTSSKAKSKSFGGKFKKVEKMLNAM